MFVYDFSCAGFGCFFRLAFFKISEYLIFFCITEVISTTPEYYEEYKETGEIPEELEKFNNDEYDWYWKMTGNDDFAEFYDQWMTMYGTIAENSQYSEGTESSDAVIDDDDFFNSDDFFNDDDFYGDESSEPEFGETPVDL